MKKLLLMLLLITLLATGCAKTSSPAAPLSPEQVVDTFLQASSAGSVETCLRLLADDVLFQQEQMGVKINGKTQLEAALRQLAAWHTQYSVIGEMKTEGNKVRFTIRQTGDEYKIMGLEYITGDIEAEVHDGKIKSWSVTVKTEDLQKIAGLTTGGIGVKFEATPGGIRITEIAKNSPLNGAGVKPGDLIVAVDGISYSQMREGEIQLRIKGPVGSKIKLTVTHEGAPAPTEIEVTRIDMAQISF
jgi:predicted metalloprotease with PDZ domain